ncbi:MAG: MBL fold metallo-hydrolase [Candidatus Aenigmarchaeota archaeon]|nr:MBL fold metallo-hydrolase [Candidatus Aenigmarchaeota archaeon]
MKGIEFIAGIGGGSNIYVIDGELLIDTGTGEYFQETKVLIEKTQNVSKLKTIINTHCHYDHSGGDKKFRDWLGATVCAHEKDRKALETGNGTHAKLFGAVSRIVTVDKKLRDGAKIKTENFSFEVVHTPGHTPGSICLYESEKKILISGDTLFENGVGRSDFEGGDRAELRTSIEKLFTLPITHLLPGHGLPRSNGINFYIKQLLVQNMV